MKGSPYLSGINRNEMVLYSDTINGRKVEALLDTYLVDDGLNTLVIQSSSERFGRYVEYHKCNLSVMGDNINDYARTACIRLAAKMHRVEEKRYDKLRGKRKSIRNQYGIK